MTLVAEETILEVIQEAVERINAEEDLEEINNGVKFENYVTMIIEEIAETHGVTVEQTGAQSFPDIIIGGSYGIEVKYTKNPKWQSMGNSIFEGTLRKEVTNQIYLIFGRKVEKRIETRFKKYEECLASIKVTHSPRFLIDMEIENENESILNALGVTYSTFKDWSDEDKSAELKKYVKSKLADGETLWWLDSNQEEGVSPKVKEYRKLESYQKQNIIIESFILFPEVFSKSSTKYLGLSVYLLQEYQIVSSSLRDAFTAGGQADLVIGNSPYKVGKIYKKLYDNAKKLENRLSEMPIEKLEEYWSTYNIGTIEESTKLDCWKTLIDKFSDDLPDELKPSLVFEEGLKV
ncbi:hypothetical protein ACIQHV_11375 [Bacillus bombysepticus]|uniref:Restriction endonuclease n=1 Tax=Bacillus thuringiensis serovar kumamotoensis TaxID=132267 RepID=A0A9X6JH29_BACUK|nr:hypothetical protein [Bacillus thuringiensis]MEC2869509.1 hypothetical protein [Bacillus cereus]OTZ65574.1 hypothetical protein BK769_33230 [Bacillus thuringiensis serovar kumamtoensis]